MTARPQEIWFAALCTEVEYLATDDGLHEALGIDDTLAGAAALAETAARLRRQLESGSTATRLATLAAGLPQLVAGLQTVASSLPSTVAPGALVEALVLRAAQHAWPGAAAVLELVGAIDPGPPLTIDWAKLEGLVADPLEALRDRFGNQLEQRAFALLEGLGRLVRGAGIATHVHERDDFGDAPSTSDLVQLELPLFEGEVAESGFVLAPIAMSPGRPITGFVLTNTGSFAASSPIEPGKRWSVQHSGNVDAARAFSCKLAPGVFELDTAAPKLELRSALSWTPDPDRAPAMCSLGGAEVSLALQGPELIARVATRPGSQSAGLVVSLAGLGDIPLIGALLAEQIEAGLDLALQWSSRSGLSIDGSATLQAEVFPVAKLGPFHIDRIGVALSPITGGVAATATIDVGATLGPIDIVALETGAALELTRAGDGDGVLGPIDIALRVLPPRGLGLSVDAPLISGGGLLLVEEDRWFGVAELNLGPTIGLSALGLAERSGSSPWSLLLSIALRTGSIPLPFGFTLDGVGGLVGLHRRFDVEALAGLLEAGELDDVLFPDDPVGDASRVLAGLGEVFPRAEGQHVVGPFVRLGWGPGVTKIVSADLGILVAFPALTLALVGRAVITLPPMTAQPIGLLQVTILGAWEPEEECAWLLGSLAGSYLGQLQLDGEAACYVGYGDEPYLLLSIGGYHPDWRPPASLPSSLASLRRISARLELGSIAEVSLSAYFALTSNSLQLGARFALEAEADLKIAKFRVVGSAEFNVLVIFSPLRIDADWKVEVAVFVGKAENELCGATLFAAVQGPDPWFVSGHAEFRALGTKIRFPLEIGSRRSANPLPLVDVLDDHLVPALQARDAWLAEAAGDALVLLRDDVDVGDAVLPDASLRVRQSVVPLAQRIERFGEAALAGGPTTFTITRAGIDGTDDVDTEIERDEFAPAGFFEMTASERLAAPSFEEFECGRRFAHATRTADDALTFEARYDEAIADPMSRTRTTLPKLAPLVRASPATRPQAVLGVRRPRYVVERDGVTLATTATYADAIREARKRPGARVAGRRA